MRGALSRSRLLGLLGLLAALALGTHAYLRYRAEPLLSVFHAPPSYPRRAGSLSANVTGWLSEHARSTRYRLNGGPWTPIVQLLPRAEPPLFVLELLPPALRPGDNALELWVEALGRPDERRTLALRYDPEPPRLPLVVDWEQAPLEAQDGYWERVPLEGGWRVRPVPGWEGYDRILLVTGAFAGGRRVETDVVFRAPEAGTPEFIVGVCALWGGHPDDGSFFPRRGWSFGMACYWSKPGGAGGEISHREGAAEPAWVNSYRSLGLEPGRRYRVVAEAVPLRDQAGTHRGHELSVQWWPADEPPPATWTRVTDSEGAPLPEGEYAVALLVYRCQADFGTVSVSPLPERIVER